ncbi:MAG TPA: hypothetical protein DEF02_02925 [Clostridiales bacterium]|nr:hypothetical protein [Clostridiales bacterium]
MSFYDGFEIDIATYGKILMTVYKLCKLKKAFDLRLFAVVFVVRHISYTIVKLRFYSPII